MKVGMVSCWYSDKAFGFIRPQGTGEEFFFHNKDLRGDARDDGGISVGKVVKYEKGWDQDKNKARARNIEIYEGDGKEIADSDSSRSDSQGIRSKKKRHRSRSRRRRSPTPQRKRRKSPTPQRKRRKSPTPQRKRKKSLSQKRRKKSECSMGSPSRSPRSRKKLSSSFTEADVVGFSDMVRLAPDLVKSVSGMKSVEIAAICAAAARVKFYDGELLEGVTKRLSHHLRISKDNSDYPSAESLVKVLIALADLNAYNQELFTAVAKVLAVQADSLNAEQTNKALKAFKIVKHQGDTDLLDRLQRRASNDRYEIAKTELWTRQLDKMYGGTQDLQGASIDTERALLTKRRLPKD